MRLILLLILAGIVLSYIYLTAPGISGRKKVNPFFGVKWAHRGLHDMEQGIVENSMSAFQRAVEEGFGIELDVHLTRDKKLVVFHDDTFDRICGVPGCVEKTDYSVMEQYRLAGTEDGIPLLQDVLAMVDGKVPLLIEVKLPDTNLEVCRVLAKELEGYKGSYMVQSFNCLVLRWMKKYRASVPRGQLSANLTKSESKPHFFFRFCVKYLLSNWICRPDFISYKWADRRNPGLWVNKVLFRTPSAAWTLHGDGDLSAARGQFDMYIFELN